MKAEPVSSQQVPSQHRSRATRDFSKIAPTPPRVLAISHRGRLSRSSSLSWDAWVEAVGQAGLDLLIREKDLDDRDLLRLVVRTRKRFQNRLLVSSRPDVARAGDADGVHLPGAGLPPAAVREFWPEAILGWSLHDPCELDAADICACDYVTVSPILRTDSKPGVVPLGFDGLRRFCHRASASGVKVLALGGIDPRSALDAVAAGAFGAAAITSAQSRGGLQEWKNFLERCARGQRA